MNPALHPRRNWRRQSSAPAARRQAGNARQAPQTPPDFQESPRLPAVRQAIQTLSSILRPNSAFIDIETCYEQKVRRVFYKLLDQVNFSAQISLIFRRLPPNARRWSRTGV